MKRSGVRIPPAPPSGTIEPPIFNRPRGPVRTPRKSLIVASISAVVAVVLAAVAGLACSGEEARTVTLRYWQAPTTPNPYFSTGDKDSDAGAITLEPLANFEPDGGLLPKLAAEIPTIENGGVAEDHLSVTWQLLQGVKWSDGTDFTAHDVVFTHQFCVLEPVGCAAIDHFGGVSSVTAIDDLTVRIEFTHETPYPYDTFVGAKLPILSRAQYQDCLGRPPTECADGAHMPVGTGPYRIVEFSSQRSEFERNPHYHGPRPYFDTVILLGGGTVESAEAEVFETAEVDYAWNLQGDPDKLLELQSLGNAELAGNFGSLVERIYVNQTNPDSELGENRSEYLDGNNPHPFLTNHAITDAMSRAIDRVHISDELYGFAGEPTCNIVAGPARYVSTSNDDCLVQDIPGANRILDEAGVIDTDGDGIREHEGNPLIITFRTTTNDIRQATQRLIKDWWGQIGIETLLTHADASFMFGEDNVRHAMVAYSRFFADVQMFTESSSVDPQVYLSGQTCDRVQSRENGWSTTNNTRHCDAEYDALYAVLEKAPLGPDRVELIKQLNDEIVLDHFQIPLVNRSFIIAHATDLQQVLPNAWDSQLWNIAEWHR